MNVIRGGSWMQTSDVVIFAMLTCLTVGVIWVAVAMVRNDADYERACRAAGGVVVRTYGAQNCATAGYIDVQP